MEKALLAKSVRDFEKSVSMVSYGFVALEDFYSQSSTRDVVGKVKIPVLFIQVKFLFLLPSCFNICTRLVLCFCLLISTCLVMSCICSPFKISM